MPGIQVDGNDVTAVYRSALNAVERARSGQGPTLLECITYRIRGHARFESSHYRPAEEVETWKKTDPIQRLRQALIENQLTSEAELASIEDRVEEEMEQAVAFAEQSEDVQLDDYLPYITMEMNHATT
jgi:pyruvate dehydrogenase E1 component alpha subunit